MKKRISTLVLTGILMITCLVAGCGKSSSSGVDGEAIGDELNNQVYKVENLDELGVDFESRIELSKNGVYLIRVDYSFEDEAMEIPEARLFSENGAVEDFDATETVDATEANDVEENADAMDDVAEAKKMPAPAEGSEELSDDMLIDGISLEEPMEDYPYYQGTATLTIKYMDYDGNEKYTFTKDLKGDYSFDYFAHDDDENLYYTACEYVDMGMDYYVGAIDSTGKEKWETKVNTSSSSDGYFSPIAFAVANEGVTLVSTNSVEIFDPASGTSKGMKASNSDISNVGLYFVAGDGKFYCIDYSQDKPDVCELDLETAKPGKKVDVPFSPFMVDIKPGTIHDVVLADSAGLSYYNFGDKEIHRFMDYVASDMNVSGINNVVEVDETTFYGSYYDDLSDDFVVAKFTKVDPTTVANKKTITLGGIWVDNQIKRKVIDYNRSNTDTRIAIIDYSTEIVDGDYDAIITKLNNDIVTGKVPDIFISNGALNTDNYIAKGVFEPLDEYWANDPDVKKSDYFENILDAMNYNGKSYCIIPSFQITSVIGKTSRLEGKTSWDMKEFRELVDKLGPDAGIFDLSAKSDFVTRVIYFNGEDYIDYDTGKVNFDSQDFIDVLEYANTLPEAIDYESLGPEYWEHYDTMYREDNLLLQVTSIYDLADTYYEEVRYFGEPVTYIGFPSNSGNGNSISYDSVMMISAKSKYKDQAWDFLKTLISDDYQDKISYSIPIKKSSFQKKAEEAMKIPTYIDEDGSTVENQVSIWINDKEILIDPPKQADIDRYKQIIESTTKVANYNSEIVDIVTEEAEAYFKGQKSAQDVAKIIQSRVQVYINEKR